MSLPPIDHTHDPALPCWVPGAAGHAEFPVQNLPLGIFATATADAATPRAGTAIGDAVLDLGAAAAAGLIDAVPAETLRTDSLNALFALPAARRLALRRQLSALLVDPARQAAVQPLLHRQADCRMQLPARIGDYTDFYVGIHHATNVGKLFRPDQPLLPNYKFVPIGYHGRASSVRPSGVAVRRPQGQRKAPDAERPSFGPSRRLDYELELGVWIGEGNALGEPIPIAEAPAHVVGFGLLNDWSARDLQAWEYQPLGPFLAKNFHTTVSPWVVTAEALAPFRIAQPARPPGDPQPLDYLWDEDDQRHGALAVELQVHLLTPRMREQGLAPHRLSRGSAASMYWTVAQIVSHHASNGCNLCPGDLLGTGTLSSAEAEGYGSLLELSRGGAEPLTLPGGEQRSFLEDGDEIRFQARAHAAGFASIGFGECRGQVLPAHG